MTYEFHALAEEELNAAVDYYEEQLTGLGYEFLEEVYSSIQRVIEFPTAWSELSSRSRRCLISRFPYGIIYQIRDSLILIIAVAHLHRRPDDWKDRE